jgi:uncharacterized protein
MTQEFDVAPHNRVRRLPERGRYERETVYQIIDEALFCHVAFVADGMPYVIPINHARAGDTLYLHGAPASRLLKHVQAGEQLCIAMTLVDGLVLARAAFHHSINYRSAVLFGHGRPVTEDAEKLQALAAITEHLAPGRWELIRRPTERELRATAVVAIAIESASAKLRAGPPKDDEEDYALPIWAGVLPLHEQPLPPVPDPRLGPGIAVPEHVKRWSRG